jgi:septum formation protein
MFSWQKLDFLAIGFTISAMNASAPLHIVLASASLRRQQFLRDLGLTFTALATDIDETPLPGEAPEAMTLRLAIAKAQAAASRLPGAAGAQLVIASDTTVAMDGIIYGKPEDAADADRMLRALRGRSHQVYSALCLLRLPDGERHTHINRTDVMMRDYSDAEIAAYVASGDPLDKAGAYGIQTAPFRPVSGLRGCFASVMGLPLADLRDLLASFGVPIRHHVAAICHGYGAQACCAL